MPVATGNNRDGSNHGDSAQNTVDNNLAETAATRSTNPNSAVISDAENSHLTGI